MSLSRRSFMTALAAGSVLAAAGRPAFAETLPPVIRLHAQGAGYGKPYGSQVIGLVRARGTLEEEFKKDGVAIEWNFQAGSGPAINEAIANGQVDFANYGGLPNIIGRSRGLPTRILASYGIGHAYLVVRKDLPVETVADIKGLKIAVTRGTVPHLTFNRVLEEFGLTEADVQIFNLEAADEVTALTTGEVDVGWGGSPFLKLADQGAVKIIYTSKGKVARSNTFGSVIGTEDFLAKYPAAAQRVMNVFLDTAHWAGDPANHDAVLDLWALAGNPRDALAKDFDGVDFRQSLSPLIDPFFLGQLQAGIDFSLANKLIRQPVDLASWVEPTFLEAGLKARGYEGYWTPRDAAGAPVTAAN